MASGMTRNALTQIQLKGKSGQAEMNEEMIRLSKKQATKIPLKNPTEHNHSK
jgi:hypothetical protein